MTTAFDYIQRDKRLQEHWVRRIVAFIVDIIIIAIIVWIITLFIQLKGFTWFFAWSFLTGVIFLFYTGFLEGTQGATFGKKLLNLRVFGLRGNMDLGKALIRNISKIFWLILLLDLIVAWVTDGDPKQRYLDRIAGTTVDDVR